MPTARFRIRTLMAGVAVVALACWAAVAVPVPLLVIGAVLVSGPVVGVVLVGLRSAARPRRYLRGALLGSLPLTTLVLLLFVLVVSRELRGRSGGPFLEEASVCVVLVLAILGAGVTVGLLADAASALVSTLRPPAASAPPVPANPRVREGSRGPGSV